MSGTGDKPATADVGERAVMDASTDAEVSPSRRLRAGRVRRWIIDLTLFAVVLVGIGLWQSRNLVDAGETAPALALEQLDGAPVDLAALSGRAVQVQFWATWCSVCRREFGALNAVQRGVDDDHMLITVVEDGDDLEALRSFVAERELTYPILIADPETLRDWHVTAFPTTYWITPDGHISARRVGAVTRWGMSWRLRQAR